MCYRPLANSQAAVEKGTLAGVTAVYLRQQAARSLRVARSSAPLKARRTDAQTPLRWIPRIAQLIALLMAGKTGKKKARLRTGNNTN